MSKLTAEDKHQLLTNNDDNDDNGNYIASLFIFNY